MLPRMCALQAGEKLLEMDFDDDPWLVTLDNTWDVSLMKEAQEGTRIGERLAKIEPVPAAPRPIRRSPRCTFAAAAAAPEAGWRYHGRHVRVELRLRNCAHREARIRSTSWMRSRHVHFERKMPRNSGQTPGAQSARTPDHSRFGCDRMSNLRSDMPRNGVRLEQASVLRHVKTREMLKVLQVEAVPGTKLYWARVTINGA